MGSASRSQHALSWPGSDEDSGAVRETDRRGEKPSAASADSKNITDPVALPTQSWATRVLVSAGHSHLCAVRARVLLDRLQRSCVRVAFVGVLASLFCACSVSDPSRPSQHPQPDQGATTSRCTLHFLAASSASWAISRFLCLGSGMCLVSASHRPPLSCFLSLALRPPSPSRSLVSALPLPLPLLSAVVVDE